MNRDPVLWEELVKDLDFLFTFAALPEHTAVKDMDADTVNRLCRLVRRVWVRDFDACDGNAIPTLTRAGRELYFILVGTMVVKEHKERNNE